MSDIQSSIGKFPHHLNGRWNVCFCQCFDLRAGAGEAVGDFASQAHRFFCNSLKQRPHRLQFGCNRSCGVGHTVLHLLCDINDLFTVLHTGLHRTADLFANLLEGACIGHLLHLGCDPAQALFGSIKGAALDDLTGAADTGHVGKASFPYAGDSGHESLVALCLNLHAAFKAVLHQCKKGIVELLLVNDLPFVVDNGLIFVKLGTLGLNHGFCNSELFYILLQVKNLRRSFLPASVCRHTVRTISSPVLGVRYAL